MEKQGHKIERKRRDGDENATNETKDEVPRTGEGNKHDGRAKGSQSAFYLW